MMKSLVMIAALLVPVATFGAEVVKFRHVGSVYLDVAGQGILGPEGVACGSKPLFVVSDTGHGRLLQYTLQDETIRPGSEIRAAQIVYPQRVRMSTGGDLFMLDGRQHRIVRLGPGGEFKDFVTGEGLPAPVAWIPKSFAIDGADNLYALDASSSRVLILGPDGKFKKQITYPQSEGFFSDVAVDAQGTIFLLNSITAAIYSAAKDADAFSLLVKGLKEFVSFPTALAVDRKHIYVIDQNGSGVILLGRDGSFQGRKLKMGWKEGELRYPTDICLDDKGDVFIADRGNNRVQIFKAEEESK
jgi:sugar lactone lactonase YvrE